MNWCRVIVEFVEFCPSVFLVSVAVDSLMVACGMMWDGGGDGSIAFVVQHIWPSKSSPCDMSDM